MAIKSSGKLAMSEIVDEFGGSASHSLSEYYAGKSYVPSSGTAIPKSGRISYSDFYGQSNTVIIHISVNTQNWKASENGLVDGGSYQIVVDTNVEVTSTDVTIPAMDLDITGTVEIVNNGYIIGRGGTGGRSGRSGHGAGDNGEDGGTAIKNQGVTLTITNNNTIGGGGGGGGGGGADFD